MKRMTLRAAACVVCCAVCIPAVLPGSVWAAITPCPTRTPVPSPTASPVPTAEIFNSGAALRPGDPFLSRFQLNKAITRQFTAYAVVVLPDKTMLNALTLDAPPKPVAENVPGLPAGFGFPLLNLPIPAVAPFGPYEVLAGFFTPGQPITKPEDAFLLARGPFTVAATLPTPTPTPTPGIPDISGLWTGVYTVTSPTPCSGMGATWSACVQMAPDGTLSGEFETTGEPVVQGDIDGTYDGGTATWTVRGDVGLQYTGIVQEGGARLNGTFSNGPDCGSGGLPVSGTFYGVIE